MTSLTDSMFEREPEASVTAEIRERVYACITYLSSVCDGAHQLDGAGFSGVHAPFGNMIAGLPVDAWTDEVVTAAYDLLPVYRKQLAGAGFDVDAIPRPPKTDGAVRRKAAVRAVTVDDGEFVIHFGYDADVVDAVRQVPGRRWDGATKTWRAPATARAEIGTFIANWNFQPDGPARALLERPATNVVPLHPEVTARGRVDVAGPSFEISFPYDRRVREDVASLPNRQWDSVNRVWRVPHYLARRVMALAETWGLDVSAAAREVPLGDGRLPVALSLDGDFVTLRCPHTDTFAHALRRTGWCRWDWRAEAWHAPAARMKDLLAVLDTQNVAVTGRDELEVAVRDADRAREWAESDEDVPPLCELGVELAGWQWGGVRYALERQRTFLGAAMGLGKTRVALATLAAADDAFPAIILVPPTLVVNWLRETTAALPGRQVQIIQGHTARPFGMYPPDVVIGSYDVAHWWHRLLIDELRPRALVVDESSGCKEWDTQRTKAAIKLGQSIPRDGVVLALSGTPVLNHRKEYAPQLAILGRLDEFGGVEQVKRMDDIADRLRAGFCMWRPPKEKILPQLPPARHAPVVIPRDQLDPAVMADYERAERELLAYLGDLAAAEASGADPFTARWERMMRASSAEQLVRIGVCKRLAAKAKLPAVKRWTETFFESEDKLLLFGGSVELLDDLGVHYDCPVIRGSSGQMNAETAVDSAARMAVVDRFQTTDLPLVVLSLQTGAQGLTLTRASHVGFVEMGWTPGIHDQAVARCYGRMDGNPHGATGWYFIAESTVDDRIVELLTSKRKEIDNAVDGIDMDDPNGNASILNDLVLSLARRALGVADER